MCHPTNEYNHNTSNSQVRVVSFFGFLFHSSCHNAFVWIIGQNQSRLNEDHKPARQNADLTSMAKIKLRDCIQISLKSRIKMHFMVAQGDIPAPNQHFIHEGHEGPGPLSLLCNIHTHGMPRRRNSGRSCLLRLPAPWRRWLHQISG